MQCIKCGAEIVSKRKDAKFCSEKCRNEHFKEQLSVADKKLSVAKPLKDYTAEELYSAIGAYEGGGWINSPESIELNKRLDTMSLKELQLGHYFIPCRLFPKVGS